MFSVSSPIVLNYILYIVYNLLIVPIIVERFNSFAYSGSLFSTKGTLTVILSRPIRTVGSTFGSR